jgi:HlyD family secretion protein
MKKKSILITIIATLLIALVVAKKGGFIGSEDLLTIETEKVFLGSITETVPANGKIQPEMEVKISPDVSGEITELTIQEGDWVEQGDLLLRINPEIYVANLDRMVASLNNVQSNLAQQKAQLKNTELNYFRNGSLFKKGAISSLEFETSENAYELAQLAVEASQFSVESSKASLNEAQNNLNRTSIYAPISGTISRLNVEQGERVVGTAQMTGTELLRIADLNYMEVVIDVSENDILRVKLGDNADVDVDAYMKENFDGVVTEIANSANLMGTSADQVTNFEVKIRILKSSYEHLISSHKHPFRPGMTASVSIKTQIKDSIKLVSIQSVTTRKDSSSVTISSRDKYSKDTKAKEPFECVFVYSKGQVKLVAVETGIQDDQNIEIISGLNEGDEIVNAPYSAVSKKLRNEMKVNISEDDKEE